MLPWPHVCKIAQNHLIPIWLKTSATPFSLGGSWTVSLWTVPYFARCLTKLLDRYLSPQSIWRTLILWSSWVFVHASCPMGLESIRFVPQEINMGKSRMVICKGDEITTPSNSFNRGWSPYVRVNLPTELGCALASTNLRDRISAALSVSAWFTEYRTIGWWSI